MRVLSMLLMALVISGCTSTGAPKDEASDKRGEESPLETRSGWLDKCEFLNNDSPAASENRSMLVAAAAAIIVPKLISGAIDSAAAYLKAAGNSKSVSSKSLAEGKFYLVTKQGDMKLNTASGCFILVRGKFSKEVSAPDYAWADNVPGLKGLQYVAFRMDAALVPIKGLKYFNLVPNYVKVNEFEEGSWFKKSRNYSVAVTMLAPGGAAPFASFEFNFPSMEVGEELKPGDWQLNNVVSLPAALPAVLDDANKAKEKQDKAAAPYILAYDILDKFAKGAKANSKSITPQPSLYADPSVASAAYAHCRQIRAFNKMQPEKFAINDERCAYKGDALRAALENSLDKAYTGQSQVIWARSTCGRIIDGVDGKEPQCKNLPTNSVVTGAFYTSSALVETREGSKFAAYLGEALSGSKEELSSLIQAQVIPAQTRANKLAEQKTEREGRQGVLLADQAVEQAESELSELSIDAGDKQSEIIAARAELLKAKFASNNAYRNAGLPVPYPGLD